MAVLNSSMLWKALRLVHRHGFHFDHAGTAPAARFRVDFSSRGGGPCLHVLVTCRTFVITAGIIRGERRTFFCRDHAQAETSGPLIRHSTQESGARAASYFGRAQNDIHGSWLARELGLTLRDGAAATPREAATIFRAGPHRLMEDVRRFQVASTMATWWPARSCQTDCRRRKPFFVYRALKLQRLFSSRFSAPSVVRGEVNSMEMDGA